MAFGKFELVAGGIALLLVLSVVLGGAMMATVPEGNRGVHTSFGATTGKTLQPGLNFVAPWEGRYNYNVRRQLYVMSSTSGEGQKESRDDSITVRSADRVKVNVDAAIAWQADPGKVVETYNEIGTEEALIGHLRSTARSCIRAEGSKYTWENLYRGASRAEFSANTEQCMKERLKEYNVVVHSAQIRNVDIPNNIDSAIDDKEAAAERIEQKRNEVKVAEAEAERKRVEAKGIKDSQEIIDETLTDEYLRYLWITEGLEKGDTVYVVPSDGAGQPVLTRDIDKGNSTVAP
jgi:regulator of protease activity HflC (stomatin/prohibitin superfamily)